MIVASIDIGTNTVLLLIAKAGNKNVLTTIINEYRIPRIGKGLSAGKPIKAEKVRELLDVLNEYEVIIKKYNCEKVLVTATNAFRIASNRNEIEENILKQFAWKVNTVSGIDEAQLSFLGTLTNSEVNNMETLVIDIGGGSTELTFGSGNKMKFHKSYNIGVVSATEKFLKNDPPDSSEIIKFEEHLYEVFDELKNLDYTPQRIIAVAGTPTTLACINQGLVQYNEDQIEGSILKQEELELLKKKLSVLPSYEIIKCYKSVVKGREDLILSGTIILLKIMEILDLSYVVVSTKGIRYGAIIKEMTKFT